jgi:hypothetical protein
MQGMAGQGCCNTFFARSPLLQHLRQSPLQNMEHLDIPTINYVAQDYDHPLQLTGATTVEQCSSGACIEGIAAVERSFIHCSSGAVNQQFEMPWSISSGGVEQWSFW